MGEWLTILTVRKKTGKLYKGDATSQNTHQWAANGGLYICASADSKGMDVS